MTARLPLYLPAPEQDSLPVLSPEETEDLAQRARALLAEGRDEEATALHWQIALGHRRILTGWVNQEAEGDYYQEGMVALFRAAQGFDPSRGPFYAVASFELMRFFAELRARNGSLTVPVSLLYARSRIINACGMEPTDAQLTQMAERLNISVEKARAAVGLRVASLDVPIYETETRLSLFPRDLLESEEVPVETRLWRSDVRAVVEQAIGRMTTSNQFVARSFFGLGAARLTQRDIAQALQISHGAVHKRVSKIRRRLQSALRSHGLDNLPPTFPWSSQ